MGESDKEGQVVRHCWVLGKRQSSRLDGEVEGGEAR